MSDKAYTAWIQKQPSCISGGFSEWLPDLGEWRNPACHVRRAGKSGTAYKEPFATVPLTDDEHRLQHQHGEVSCLKRYSRDGELLRRLEHASQMEAELIAKDWFNRPLERYRRRWRALNPET